MSELAPDVELGKLGTMPSATTRLKGLGVVVAYQRRSDSYLISLYEKKGRPSTVALWDGELSTVGPNPTEEAREVLYEVIESIIPMLAESMP